MNLRHVRIRLTVVYAVITALTVFAISWYAAQAGADRIYEAAEREAEDILATHLLDQSVDSKNTWLVNELDGWSDVRGPAEVEPPLFTLVERAGSRDSFQRFEQDGPWLALVRNVDDGQFLVSTVSLTDDNADVSSLRWRIALAALGSVLLATWAGWFVAGRSLVPARQAARQQRDFIADAAHELRTPLAVIQASASHTLSRPREVEAYQESLREIMAATERASLGVGELLELARLEAGQAQPRTAPLRLDLLIEEVAAGIRVDGVTIEARPSIAVVVDADYGLLRQIVESLVRNGASRADRVWITAVGIDGNAVLDIADDGPGFPDEVLPHVFDRFRRGDTKGGSGLGMAIAKSVVEAHNGTIEAHNQDDGGALVRVRLPLSKG